MTSLRHALGAFVLACLACLAACQSASPPATSAPSTTSSSCALELPGPPLDAHGRADGLYTVQHDQLGATPLVRLPSMHWDARGADADSGKRWERVTVAPGDAARLHAYTAGADREDVAMVLDGQVIARHKVRTVIDHELQVSCCDARVCDRWEALLGAPPRGTNGPSL